MNNITTIFFDIDNTLINHSLAQLKGIEVVRKKFFPQVAKEKFESTWLEIQERFWGPYMRGEITYLQQRTQRMSVVWNRFGQTITPAQMREGLDLQLAHYQNAWEAFPYVRETLQLLRNKGYALGILTNGNKDQQTKKLQKIDVLKYIDEALFFASEEVGLAKPDPKIFLLAQKTAQALEKNILFIGDDLLLDIKPAQKIGWNTLQIDHFKQHPDKQSIQSLQEVISMFV